MIKISHLNKIYKSKKRKNCHALNDINLTLPDNGLVFVLGKSGSGKSTLLNLIGGLDNVTSGSIEVDGNDLAKFREKDFCNYRNTHIGFIFQDYHLIDELTVYENIVLSLNLRKLEDKEDVKNALARVDLAGYEDRYPSELSGGEQQRVAIARAIVKKPRIILADEPTGNLDTNTARAIVELLKELSRECLILVVSHNINDANSYADRIIELKKGEIISDVTRNPDFADEVTLKDGELVYPQGLALSRDDIDLLNKNKTAEIILKTDKFLPTNEPKAEGKKVKIENKGLSLFKKLRLSGKFLKSKTFAIGFSSFMVATIMVIMALAQTIIAFDGSKIVAEEMAKSNLSSMLLTKVLDEETQAMLNGSYLAKVDKNDAQAFYNAGYNGKIYKGITYTMPITSTGVLKGQKASIFTTSIYVTQTIATLIVDNDFLESKFGEVKYCARRSEFHPQGVIITDYIADAILLLTNGSHKGKDYEYLVKYGYTAPAWGQDGFIINGIIETGYKDTYKDLFEQVSKDKKLSISDLKKDPAFQSFFNDVYDRLGYSYTLNQNFTEEYLASECWSYPSYYKMVFNDIAELSYSATYILENNPNGSKPIHNESTEWRCTETPPTIPEGAKYIRISYHNYYIKHFFGMTCPILAFDNGAEIDSELLSYNNNYRLETNGTLKFASNYVVSDYIEIPENATITEFFTLSPSNSPYYAFYDGDKNFISSEIAQKYTIETENTILMPAKMYETIFPNVVEKLGENWIDKITPQKMKLSHFAYWDAENENPLFEREVTVQVYNESYIRLSEDLFSLFYKDSVFEHVLYFDGTEGIGAVLDNAEALNYEPQSYTAEGIHTMTTAVDVFVPIFELVAIFLCIGVIFILMSFASKMIKDKMHEIGIMKALGMKNNSIGVIFGLQVMLIAILTCALATAGYYYFIDLANTVLVESLMRFNPSSVVLDLDFLKFNPNIAMENCILIFILAFASLFLPMIKIKAIKPVKIIKAKE